MNHLKSKWICYCCFLFINPSYGALGNHSSEYSEITGVLVGIFFIWSLMRIIKNGNAKEEEKLEEDQFDIIDHLVENDTPKNN